MEQDGASDSSFQEKFLHFLKSNILIVGLLGVGIILIGIGLIQILAQKQASIKFERGQDVAGMSSSKIKVDVEGAVIKPGVYELSSDARVQDALIAAGGLASDANRTLINLAAKIADGQKIYVPAQGEVVAGVSSVNNSNSGLDGAVGLVSINSATQAQLEELPGVGPVTAAKIIDNRPYGAPEELLSRKIVGKSTFEKIQNKISL